MRKRFFVDFHVDRSEGDRFKEYMKELALIEFWNDPHNERALPWMSHTLDGDDPTLNKLRALLKQEGIEWSEREEHIYTDDELRSFPLLTIGVDRKPIQGGGPEYGTTYDLTRGCLHCGTGAIQTSPLMIVLSGLPKKGLLCATCLDEILVAERLALALKEAEITGLELRHAHFYRNDEPLPWWQMISDYCMPKMSPATRGIVLSETDHVERPDFIIPAEPPCHKCKRDGRFGTPDEPEQIVYSLTDVDPDSIPDVVHTWDCTGKSMKYPPKGQFPRYRQPMILVKPKILDIFRRLKVKHVTFGPIRIMD